MTNIQYRISFFRFAMSLACTLFIATIYLQVSDTHASMLERVCERGFIGYSYKPMLEKRCKPLWNKWSEEIKVSFNQK